MKKKYDAKMNRDIARKLIGDSPLLFYTMIQSLAGGWMS